MSHKFESDIPVVPAATTTDLQDVPIVMIDDVEMSTASPYNHQTSNKVRVVAPSNLSAGYHLPVSVDGQSRIVQVVSWDVRSHDVGLFHYVDLTNLLLAGWWSIAGANL